MKETWQKVWKYPLFYLILPIVLDFIIECLNRKSLSAAMVYIYQKPFLFLFNVLIIMFTCSIASFFRKEIFVLTLVSSIWMIFGIVNFVILQFRVTPFSAVDFTLIESAIGVMSHYISLQNIAMIFVAVFFVIASLVVLFIKAPCRENSLGKKKYLYSAILLVGIFFCIVGLHRSSSSVQALSKDFTNISEAYENYGFVYCFANSLIDTGIKKPVGYSEEAVDTLVSQLRDKKSATKKPNIVMVQLESFFDVNTVKNLQCSCDPIPVFHSLQKKYTHGYLTVPTVGAGTVNTEFEVLTGMSQHDFGVGEYPYKTVLKSQSVESICTDLRKLGYASHCVHNNIGTFYGRNTVFSHLGFDSFTSMEYMHDLTLNPNGWVKDNVMPDEIIKTLDSTPNQDFTFGITVQSHGKYSGIKLKTPQKIKISGVAASLHDEYQYYVNQLKDVDTMLGQLIKKLKKRKEPVVLLVYGDHLPSLNLTKAALKNENLYQTEYAEWDNIGLKAKKQDLCSYQLYPTLLKSLGIHEGMITKYHQQMDWNSGSYLTDLKMLEYDILYGLKYAYQGKNVYQPTALSMGTEPVMISDVTADADGYQVKGFGFTNYTHVLFNGNDLAATYVNPHTMHISSEVDIKGMREEDAQDTASSQKEVSVTEAPDQTANGFVIQMQTGDGVALSESPALLWKNTSLEKER